MVVANSLYIYLSTEQPGSPFSPAQPKNTLLKVASGTCEKLDSTRDIRVGLLDNYVVAPAHSGAGTKT
jgi:hypothetical protein